MGDQIEPPSEVLEVVLEAGKEAQLRGGKASLMGRYRQDGKRNGKPKYTIVDGSGQSNGAFIHWEDGSRSGKGKFWGITGNDEASGSWAYMCRNDTTTLPLNGWETRSYSGPVPEVL